jgi:sugar phosphate isomerase/epimerase
MDAYRNKDEYAVSTFLYEEDYTVDLALEAIARAGFTQVELWADRVHVDPRCNVDIPAVKRQLSDLGLHAHAIHTPFRGFDRFDDQDAGRAWRKDLWKRSLDIAGDLEIPVAVIHALSRREYNYTYDQVGYLADLLAELADHAHKRGVQLAVENIPSSSPPVKDEVLCTLVEQKKLFGGIDHLYWCLDIGHVTITSNDMKAEIDASIDRLVTLHIHNNDGNGDQHWLPTDGVIDWPHWYTYLRTNGYTGSFVLEVAGNENPQRVLDDLSKIFERE